MPEIAAGGEQGEESDKEGGMEDEYAGATARNPKDARRPAAPTKAVMQTIEGRALTAWHVRE